MNFKLRILPRAERDVQQIFDFISERSSTGAVRWWKAFHEAACRAASSPHAYPVAAEQLISSFELRQFLFKTRRGRAYRGVFALVDDEVRILRVRGPGQASLTDDELSNE